VEGHLSTAEGLIPAPIPAWCGVSLSPVYLSAVQPILHLDFYIFPRYPQVWTGLMRRALLRSPVFLRQSLRPPLLARLQHTAFKMAEEPSKAEECSQNEQLPKLSPSEFRQYNRMAEHMNYYVRRFLPRDNA
jgi:hypothetical protein